MSISICRSMVLPDHAKSSPLNTDRWVAYRMSTLPDVESLSILDGDRVVHITQHLHVVSWHDHLGTIFDVVWPV